MVNLLQNDGILFIQTHNLLNKHMWYLSLLGDTRSPSSSPTFTETHQPMTLIGMATLTTLCDHELLIIAHLGSLHCWQQHYSV